jgi:arginine/serine-rich splicing factor 17
LTDVFVFHRYDWDNFFIENKEMNEMKPGERPDTIHVQVTQCLPVSSS